MSAKAEEHIMAELSDEERQERGALRHKKAALKNEGDELKARDNRTPAQQATFLVDYEFHQVAVKKLHELAQAYEIKWGRSPWGD
jgi:hypothetical protein